MNERSDNSGGSVEVECLPHTTEVTDVVRQVLDSLDVFFTTEREE